MRTRRPRNDDGRRILIAAHMGCHDTLRHRSGKNCHLDSATSCGETDLRPKCKPDDTHSDPTEDRAERGIPLWPSPARPAAGGGGGTPALKLPEIGRAHV